MKILFKFNFTVLFLACFLGACGDGTLKKIGLKKEEVDAFTVSRKQALDMPPDMILRPPGKEKKISTIKYKKLKTESTSDLSLEDILFDNPNLNNKPLNSRRELKTKRSIVNKILNTKAQMVIR